ncbi:MAG: protein-export chaperone SecB [Salinispira sp.]
MNKAKEWAKIALSELRVEFPNSFFSLSAEEDYANDFEDDYYYVIDSDNSSAAYLKLIFELSEKMWADSIYNVLFICNEGSRRITTQNTTSVHNNTELDISDKKDTEMPHIEKQQLDEDNMETRVAIFQGTDSAYQKNILNTEETLLTCELSVEISPDDKTFFLKATMVGIYKKDSEPPNVSLPDFAKIHAPAHIFPYLRELISSTTARAGLPIVMLPPTNLHTITQSNVTQ